MRTRQRVVLCGAALLMLHGAPALAQAPGPGTELPAQVEVGQARLMETLRSLPTARAALGDEASREGLRRTETLLTEALTALGYTPQVHQFKWALPMQPQGKGDGVAEGEHTYRNIIVEIPGRSKPDEVLLIGAHFDAVPGAPGADDNGSGTAALLELARVLKDVPMQRTVRLVFFNLEEVGLVGSSAYVKWLREQGQVGARGGVATEGERIAAPARLVGMISLEMLGYYSDEPGSQKSPVPPIKGVFEPPTVGDNIALVGFKRDEVFIRSFEAGMKAGSPGLKVFAFAFPLPLPDLMRSDHQPFYLAGVPAAMLTDTANFRNPNYHKATDTADTIDAERYARTVRGVASAVVQVAGEVEAAQK